MPIDAIEGVTSILMTLIEMLENKDIFSGFECLAHCTRLYETWESQSNAGEFKGALARMLLAINTASCLLNKVTISKMN